MESVETSPFFCFIILRKELMNQMRKPFVFLVSSSSV